MSGLVFTVTDAGRTALVNAQNTGTAPVIIAAAGITASAVVPSTTTSVLPGEIKRIATLSGDVVDDDTIHLIVRDETSDSYELRSFALYLGDGTLFGIYGQPDPIMEKSAQSMLLLAVDVRFADVNATLLTFGDANFLNPPATTAMAGVVELATEVEATTGSDQIRAITPKSLKSAVTAWLDDRLGAGSPTTFVKGLLAATTAAGFRTALALKSAALKDEGPGGGLDADTLDGNHAGAFAAASHAHTIGHVSGLQTALDAKLPLSGSAMSGRLGFVPGTAALPGLYAVGDANTGLFTDDPANLAIATGGLERLRVIGNGCVGIGTGSPKALLDVAGAARISSGIMRPDGLGIAFSTGNGENANFGALLIRNAAGSTELFKITTAGSLVFNADTGTYIHRPLAATLAFATGNAERLRIDAAGHVGIGTSTPTLINASGGTKLSIASNSSAGAGYAGLELWSAGGGNGVVTGAITFGTTAATGGKIGATIGASNEGNISTTAIQGLVFFTNSGSGAAEKVRITSGGNLGVGTSAPSDKLHVAGNARIDAELTVGTGTGGLTFSVGNSSNTGYVSFYNAAKARQGYIGYAPTGGYIDINADGAAGYRFNKSPMVGGDKVWHGGDADLSAAVTGYCRLPNGLIMQWGTGSVAANSYGSITYPLNFGSWSKCFIEGGVIGPTSQDNNPFVSGTSLSGATVYNAVDGTVSFTWFAIGF